MFFTRPGVRPRALRQCTAVNRKSISLTSTHSGGVISGLTPDQTFFWRVRARSAAVTGLWSPTFSFRTRAGASTPTVELFYPAEDQTDVELSPRFDWSDLAGALSYELLVSKDSTFQTGLHEPTSGLTVSEDTLSVPLDSLADYFWKVRAIQPAAIAPQGGEVVFEAEDYDYKIARSGHDWTEEDQSGDRGTSLTATPNDGTKIASDYASTSPELQYRINFAQAGAYRVWVRFSGSSGANDEWHVGLDGQAGLTMVPDALYGHNGWAWSGLKVQQGADNEAVLQVSTPGVHTFNLWMSEDGLSVDQILLTTNTAKVPTGSGETASPRQGANTAIESAVGHFTTGTGRPPVPDPLPAPALLKPNHQAVKVSSSPLFAWHGFAAARRYEMDIDTSASFTTGRRVPIASGDETFRDTTAMLVLLRDTTYYYFTPSEAAAILSDTQHERPIGYVYNDLLPVTTYYWRLRAVDDLGQEGAWSTVREFTTDSLRITRYYYLTDHLGSVRATVNEEGRVVHYDDYYPFGQPMPRRSEVNGTYPKERFTGHELDTETDLYYAGARYLDPVIGRWMSVDPLADKYPGWSPYNYVADNPLNKIDENGDSISVVIRNLRGLGWLNAAHAFLVYYPEECKEGESCEPQNIAEAFNSGSAPFPGKLVKSDNENEDEYDNLTTLQDPDILGQQTIELPEGMTDEEFVAGVTQMVSNYQNDTNYPEFGINCTSRNCANSNSFIGTILREMGIDIQLNITRPVNFPILRSPGVSMTLQRRVTVPMWNVNVRGLRR